MDKFSPLRRSSHDAGADQGKAYNQQDITADAQRAVLVCLS
jgi:hypothetical protein